MNIFLKNKDYKRFSIASFLSETGDVLFYLAFMTYASKLQNYSLALVLPHIILSCFFYIDLVLKILCLYHLPLLILHLHSKIFLISSILLNNIPLNPISLALITFLLVSSIRIDFSISKLYFSINL